MSGDVRDAVRVLLVIHMAAQSHVRPPYTDPGWMVETNVLGTPAVLEAISGVASLQSTVVVMADKAFRNEGRLAGYRENDALGGHDPYGASKAMADIHTAVWMLNFPGSAVGIARAGNVIGGGDISTDRLMPMMRPQPLKFLRPNSRAI